MRAPVVRFSIWFVASLALQWVCLLVWAFIFGDSSRLTVIYRPFVDLTERFIRGRSYRDLEFIGLGAVALGSIAYSLIAGLSTLLFRWPKHESPTSV